MTHRPAAFWTQAMAACCFAYVVAGNVATLPAMSLAIPVPLRSLGTALGLHQRWSMFAPSVPTDDGWFVIRGVRQDGAERDLLSGGFVRWEKPVNVAATFPSYRWLAYLRRMWWLRHTGYPGQAADYFCRRANTPHAPGGRVSTVQIIYMLDAVQSSGQPRSAAPVLVAESACGSAASVP